MHPLSNQELLDLWDKGLDQGYIERAISILVMATPESEPGSLAMLSMGQRDELLIRLREMTFGPMFFGLTTCPGCNDHLEMSFLGSEIAPPENVSEKYPIENLKLDVSGYEMIFRVPNSLDIISIYDVKDLSEARRLLLDLCIKSVKYGSVEIPTSQIPAEVLDSVVHSMGKTDPQGDIQISLSCGSCGHQWQMIFDILHFFWAEIDAFAHRIIHDVHGLASAYGWSESEILNMSPRRRKIYLDLVGE
jgi:hypothetical protein